MLAEAQFFYQRGVLALYDGDTATARASFEEVFRPQGLSFDDVLICHTESSFFLRQQFDVRQFMPSAQFLRPYALMIDRQSAPPTGGPK